MEEITHKLKYRLIEASSEDPDHPLYELMRGTSSNGWMSVRFCTYPQEIIIQFLTPVNLKQINILSNEKKITSMIEFYSYYPSTSVNGGATYPDIYNNYKRVTFQKLGYIRMDTNSRTNYKAREFRKVFINTNCIYLKLVLQKNYLNKYNVFNQVGIISIDFFGIPFLLGKSDLYLRESLKNFDLTEEDLDDVSQEKIKILKGQQEEAIRNEDYDEAKRLKISIDKIKHIGRKIFELETQKKVYVNNEDFDNAKIMKFEIDRLKSSLKFVDKNLTIVPYSNLSMDMSPQSNDVEENKDRIREDTFETSKSLERDKEV
jgi:centrosomal protein CEP104